MTREDFVQALEVLEIEAQDRFDYIIGGFLEKGDGSESARGIPIWTDFFTIRPRPDGLFDCILPGPAPGGDQEEIVEDLESALAWVLREWRPRPRRRVRWEQLKDEA